MKQFFKKNDGVKVFFKALIVLVAGIWLSCTGDSPTEPVKETKNVIYYFTGFINDVTREYETHFCRMNDDGSDRMKIIQFPGYTNFGNIEYSTNMKRVMLGTFYIMDITGKNRTHVADAQLNESYQAVSPDGERFFQSYQGLCYVSDRANGWIKRQLFQESAKYNAWLYDSKRIIYNSSGSIISINADSALDRKVIYKHLSTEKPGYALRCYPSQYEDKIIFERYGLQGNNKELCLINGDGTDFRIIYSYPSKSPSATIADWSKDSKSVLLYRNYEHDLMLMHIYLLKLDGSGLQQVTPEPIRFAGRVCFSPDDKKIVYGTYIPDQTRLTSQYILQRMDIDGKNIKTLTPSGYNDAAPAWVKR